MEDGKKENKKNKIIRNDIGYKKSNILISSKYKADLLENKILTYALAHVQKDGHYDENGQIIYSFSASEIRNILGIRSGSFYEKLKVTAEEMMGRMIALENAESHKFDYINIINRATYEDGTFTIKFNSDIQKGLVLDITKNFTQLSLNTMLSFKNQYAFRVYELLKSQCWDSDGTYMEGHTYFVSYNISEFKFIIGVVDAEDRRAKDIIRKGKDHVDWSAAEEAAEEKMNMKWQSLKTRVIEPAIKEINTITEMYVEYDTHKTGKSHKVDSIDFRITRRSSRGGPMVVTTVSDEQKEDMILSLINGSKEAGYRLSMKNAEKVAEIAGYSQEKIRMALLVLQQAQTEIEDITAFLISAIKKEYAPVKDTKEEYEQMEIWGFDLEQKKKVKKRAAKAPTVRFSDFQQNDIDFNELERRVLANPVDSDRERFEQAEKKETSEQDSAKTRGKKKAAEAAKSPLSSSPNLEAMQEYINRAKSGDITEEELRQAYAKFFGI